MTDEAQRGLNAQDLLKLADIILQSGELSYTRARAISFLGEAWLNQEAVQVRERMQFRAQKGVLEARVRELEALGREPKRLKPSEVTEPGHYWICGDSPEIQFLIRPQTVEVTHDDQGRLVVYQIGSRDEGEIGSYPDAIRFIGPLTPPEDE